MTKPFHGPIIDPHHHLWDLTMNRHAWLSPAGPTSSPLGNLALIQRSYLVDDYRRDSARQNVVASIHIEAGWDRTRNPVEETLWLETLDKSSGVALRYVGYVPLAHSSAAAIIAEQAAFRRVVGIRELLSWHPGDPTKSFAKGPGLVEDTAWRAGLARLRRHDLHLELMLYPYQAAEVAALAGTFSDQQFIINHCAGPIDRDREGLLRWRHAVRQLSERPNIAIKISALAAYDLTPTISSMQDVVLHCIDCFGVERSMFASDYPVGRLWSSFDQIFDLFKQIASGFTEMEQRALFHDNAYRYYRMT